MAFEWTQQRTEAAALLAAGETQADVADVVGVTPRTLRRWMKEDAFAERVNGTEASDAENFRNGEPDISARIEALERRITADEARCEELSERIEELEQQRSKALAGAAYDDRPADTSDIETELDDVREELERIQTRLPAGRERLQRLREQRQREQTVDAYADAMALKRQWLQARLELLDAQEQVETLRQRAGALRQRLRDHEVSIAMPPIGGSFAKARQRIERALDNLEGEG